MYLCKECGHYVFDQIKITTEVTSPIIKDSCGGIQSVGKTKIESYTLFECRECHNTGDSLDSIAEDVKGGR